jgi:hypothetical protein
MVACTGSAGTFPVLPGHTKPLKCLDFPVILLCSFPVFPVTYKPLTCLDFPVPSRSSSRHPHTPMRPPGARLGAAQGAKAALALGLGLAFGWASARSGGCGKGVGWGRKFPKWARFHLGPGFPGRFRLSLHVWAGVALLGGKAASLIHYATKWLPFAEYAK